MKQNKKYLGINQPIPYKVLDEVLYHYFNNNPLAKEGVIKLLKEYIHGENRLNKAYSHIILVFRKNDTIIIKLKSYMNTENYLNLSENDRICLAVCLIALTFPVTYDLLNILSSGFKVQKKINRNYIDQKMSSMYGSNRGIYNAVNAIMPMIVELGLIHRDKSGIYEFTTTKKIVNKILNEFFIYTDIKLSGSKSILLDDIEYRSWYLYFEPRFRITEKYSFVKSVESRIGLGYLTI